VIDPTGAGDAYCGGFVAGWIATQSPVVAAACGTVAASEIIGAFGAFGGAPDRGLRARLDSVDQILASHGSSGGAVTDRQEGLRRLHKALDHHASTP
jgi:hypothetical protein